MLIKMENRYRFTPFQGRGCGLNDDIEESQVVSSEDGQGDYFESLAEQPARIEDDLEEMLAEQIATADLPEEPRSELPFMSVNDLSKQLSHFATIVSSWLAVCPSQIVAEFAPVAERFVGDCVCFMSNLPELSNGT